LHTRKVAERYSLSISAITESFLESSSRARVGAGRKAGIEERFLALLEMTADR
jgi:hypothetical protein